jgi:leader peptidase (prepilin peptidase)/N-methyltransferase
MRSIIVAALTVLGAAVGSFLNVVRYRRRHGMSVVSPGSQCPDCGSPIRWRHNIPVIGWLLLRGHCHDCGGAISVRYPLVETAAGAVYLAVGLAVAHRGAWTSLPPVLGAATVAIALIALGGGTGSTSESEPVIDRTAVRKLDEVET